MKNRHILTIAAAALLGLTACSEQMEPQGAPGSRAVRLAASTTTLTRAADGIYSAESGFTGDEQVEVFMNSDAKHATYQLAAAAGGTSAMSSATPLDYPEEPGDVTLYAVYPATSQTSHTVAHDQTGADGYRQSDLMFAKTVVSDAQRDAEQTLVFQHQLVKLKVVVTKPADISTLGGITLQNVKRKVSVTLAPAGLTVGTAAAADDGAGNSILVSGAEGAADTEQTYTYACVLPETTWGADDTFITATVDGQQVDYKLGSETTLSAGSEYTLTMTVSNNGMDANTASLSAWGTLTQATVAALTAANALVIEGDIADQTWTKTGAQPVIGTVKTAAGAALNSSDYDVSYYNNTTVTDEAFVVVTGKNSHAGKVGYKTFRIVAKADGVISYAETTLTKIKNEVFTNPLTNDGDGIVTYESDNTAVATVNSATGEVTAVAAGTAKIKATVTNSTNCTYATATATYNLTVESGMEPGSVDNDALKTKILVLGADGLIYVSTASLSDAKSKASSAGTVPVGIVSYLGSDAGCTHGLAVALDEVAGSATTMWGGYNNGTHFTSPPQLTTDNNTAKTDMKGQENTNALVNCTSHIGTNTSSNTTYHHYPAKYCHDYSVNTSSASTPVTVNVTAGQWFLASAGQWEKMRSSNTKLFTAEGRGGCGLSGYYWSSSEYNAGNAWYVHSEGLRYNNKSSTSRLVRPVLAF